jgi:outer membrane protein
MRSSLVIACTCAFATTAFPAFADGGQGETTAPKQKAADRSGVSVGARVGWGFPIGSLTKGDSFGDNLSGILPIWFDVGYRISPEIYLGGYFQWGIGFVSQAACVAPLTSCSGDDVRFGLNLHWHVKSALGAGPWSEHFDPWVGFGAGYEIATITLERGSDRSHQTFRGFEFGNLQVGGDYLGLGSMRLGGFAVISLAEFTRSSVSVPTGVTSFSIAEPEVHAWLVLGVRGQYDF